MEENIAAGAADTVDAIHRYEQGEGSEAELLHYIEHVDGWNLDARIKSLATALGAPPLDAPTAPLSGGEKRRVALCTALACP